MTNYDQAVRVVADLLSRGYTVQDAASEVMMGAARGYADFSISHGVISVPAMSKDAGDQFSFSKIAASLKGESDDGQLLMGRS